MFPVVLKFIKENISQVEILRSPIQQSMDSNFNTAACAADLRSMQISHTTPQKPGHFCGMPHSAPRCTIPHYAA
jgi:hypothetical protein